MLVQGENVALDGRQPADTSGYPSVSVPSVECVINQLPHLQDGIL
jgi:hypothetical protein